MYRRSIFIFFTLFVLVSSVSAQEIGWKAGIYSFFDNTEFARSTLTVDQTMAGVHLIPELVVRWDTIHAINAGIDLMKGSGTKDLIDKFTPVIYYRYKNEKTVFFAGAFQREDLFDNYSDLFFTDSIRYYRPVVNGLYYKAGDKNSFINLWLDWTIKQTATDRESFYAGISARKKLGIFYGSFESYLVHYANTKPSIDSIHVSEHILTQTSVGIDLSGKTFLNKLIFQAGLMAGIERIRNVNNETYSPVGCVLNLNLGYKKLNIDNLLYVGDARLKFYKQYNNNFYWNNPFLQAGTYGESRIYLNVIENRFVTGKLGTNIHFSQNKIMFEQLFTLSANLEK